LVLRAKRCRRFRRLEPRALSRSPLLPTQAQAEVRALRSSRRPADAAGGGCSAAPQQPPQQQPQQRFSALLPPPPNPAALPSALQTSLQQLAAQQAAQAAQAAALAADPERAAFEHELTAFLQSPAGAAAVAATGGTRNCATPTPSACALLHTPQNFARSS
jgi:hypothetical protein